MSRRQRQIFGGRGAWRKQSLPEAVAEDRRALGVEPHELLIVAHEEPRVSALRVMIEDLLREADLQTLQVVYKVVKALLH